jgi:hypothetical protein
MNILKTSKWSRRLAIMKSSRMKFFFPTNFTSILLLMLQLFWGAGCGSPPKERLRCDIFTEKDADEMKASVAQAIANDAQLQLLHQFASSAVTAFSLAPTLPGNYEWNGKAWLDKSDSNQVELTFPGNWKLTSSNREEVPIVSPWEETLTGPGINLHKLKSGILDGAYSWTISSEMGDWKDLKYNCYSCGIWFSTERGEKSQTPWASFEKHENFPVAVTLSIQLPKNRLKATFKDVVVNYKRHGTSSLIEFNGASEKFNSDQIPECPGLRARIEATFPVVDSILSSRRNRDCVRPKGAFVWDCPPPMEMFGSETVR